MRIISISLFLLSFPSFLLAESKWYDYRTAPEYASLTNEEKQKLEQVHREFVLLRGALDLYAEEHDDQAPKTLDELVPRYLHELPKDPFATTTTAVEKKLGLYTSSLGGWGYRYRQGRGDSWVISSVGLEGFPFQGKNNVDLYRAKGEWISGKQFILTEE